MEPDYTPQPRRRRADRYLQENEQTAAIQQQTDQPPVQQAVQPPVRPVYQRPQPAQKAQQPRPQSMQPQRTVHYAQQGQPMSRPQVVNRQPPVRTQPPIQQRPADSYRSASRDHMLETPVMAEHHAAPAENRPLPAWTVPTILITFLLALACFSGRMLIDAYLFQQQELRRVAHEQVVQAHPLQYEDLIRRYAMEYNLHPAFVASIILNESSYSTRAESGVGARGLMQLMPDTAQWIAHKLGMDATYNVELLWDAETNIRFGCWYLNYLNNQFGGDAVTVASAYHTGQGEVNNWLRNRSYAPDGRALRLDTMPEGPTRVYAGRVTRDYAIYDALYFNEFNPPVSQ